MKRQKARSKMGVKEKALTAASSIASGDFLRMVTGAGAARKSDYAELAKAIVEEYNGSTIAGSAQTLKAALDSLNSNPQVASGKITIPPNQGTGVLTLQVTFSQEFENLPKVCATWNEAAGSGFMRVFDGGAIGVTNITKNGFNISLSATTDSQYSWNLCWIAVG